MFFIGVVSYFNVSSQPYASMDGIAPQRLDDIVVTVEQGRESEVHKCAFVADFVAAGVEPGVAERIGNRFGSFVTEHDAYAIVWSAHAIASATCSGTCNIRKVGKWLRRGPSINNPRCVECAKASGPEPRRVVIPAQCDDVVDIFVNARNDVVSDEELFRSE